jgi:hypothetical protein
LATAEPAFFKRRRPSGGLEHRRTAGLFAVFGWDHQASADKKRAVKEVLCGWNL